MDDFFELTELINLDEGIVTSRSPINSPKPFILSASHTNVDSFTLSLFALSNNNLLLLFSSQTCMKSVRLFPPVPSDNPSISSVALTQDGEQAIIITDSFQLFSLSLTPFYPSFIPGSTSSYPPNQPLYKSHSWGLFTATAQSLKSQSSNRRILGLFAFSKKEDVKESLRVLTGSIINRNQELLFVYQTSIKNSITTSAIRLKTVLESKPQDHFSLISLSPSIIQHVSEKNCLATLVIKGNLPGNNDSFVTLKPIPSSSIFHDRLGSKSLIGECFDVYKAVPLSTFLLQSEVIGDSEPSFVIPLSTLLIVVIDNGSSSVIYGLSLSKAMLSAADVLNSLSLFGSRADQCDDCLLFKKVLPSNTFIRGYFVFQNRNGKKLSMIGSDCVCFWTSKTVFMLTEQNCMGHYLESKLLNDGHFLNNFENISTLFDPKFVGEFQQLCYDLSFKILENFETSQSDVHFDQLELSVKLFVKSKSTKIIDYIEIILSKFNDYRIADLFFSLFRFESLNPNNNSLGLIVLLCLVAALLVQIRLI
ncbi:hypothetical protein GEMRC1_004553 [Eukaryota sp. GEM-RC1]